MEGLTAMIKNLETKFDVQANELRDMKQSITQSINNNIDSKFTHLETKYNALEKVVEEQGRRIQQLEKSTRKKNLIFFGIEEQERSYYNLQNIILNIINSDMKISCSKENIEEVRRLGKKQGGGKLRPVIVTFNTMGMKIQLLKNKKKLSGTPFYIKEDFPPEVLEERKRLQGQLLEEKKKGHKAFLSYDKLVIIPETTQKKYNNSNRNNNKRPLPESPETRDECSSNSNSNRKPPKKQNIEQYMIRGQNANTDASPYTSPPSPSTVTKSTEPTTSNQSSNSKKY